MIPAIISGALQAVIALQGTPARGDCMFLYYKNVQRLSKNSFWVELDRTVDESYFLYLPAMGLVNGDPAVKLKYVDQKTEVNEIGMATTFNVYEECEE